MLLLNSYVFGRMFAYPLDKSAIREVQFFCTYTLSDLKYLLMTNIEKLLLSSLK